jgi:hypothetical protein
VRQVPKSKSQTAEEQKITIASIVPVRNGVRAIEFYKTAFGVQAGELPGEAGQTGQGRALAEAYRRGRELSG